MSQLMALTKAIMHLVSLTFGVQYSGGLERTAYTEQNFFFPALIISAYFFLTNEYNIAIFLRLTLKMQFFFFTPLGLNQTKCMYASISSSYLLHQVVF